MSKLETIADNNFNVAAMVGPFFDKVENNVFNGLPSLEKMASNPLPNNVEF